MQSATMVLDQGRVFPTTFGFKATSGFDLQVAAPPPLTVRTRPSEDGGSLGWKGLLEISRTSGASGVLGSRSLPEDSGNSKDCKVEICCTPHTSTPVRRLVKSVIRGLKACQEPEKALEGMGGTYFFLNDKGQKAAIMKPCDEEPLAPNNPKGYVGRQLGDAGWKPTVRVGEAAMREVAAFLLDHDGFAKVPTSVLVRARHPVFCYNSRMHSVGHSCLDLTAAANMEVGAELQTGESSLPMKLGSLQEFVNHECDTSEMGSSRFSTRDVHHIGVFDIRTFNTDRHAGNMLVRASNHSSLDLKSAIAGAPYELIPIDHGFCLPETLEAPYFEWLHWPQTMRPFSEEDLEYIRKLDAQADIELLRKELPNLRPECLRVLEVSTTLLKACAATGHSLFEIASILTRPITDADEGPSELERICVAARQEVETYMWCVDDEGEGSDNDTFDNYNGDIDNHVDMELSPHSSIATPPGLSPQGQQGGAEELVFGDLEDTWGNGSTIMIKTKAGNMEVPMSPSTFSITSSISSIDHMSYVVADITPSSIPLPVIRTITNMSTDSTHSTQLEVTYGQMARSVHATDGYMWRSRKGTQSVSVKRRPKACPVKRRTQAYPPPITATAASFEGGIFSNLSEVQWEKFMEIFCELCQEAIMSGQWKQAARDREAGPVAMSCPKF